MEWYKEVYGPTENSPVDPNQSGDGDQIETGGQESLEDWMDTICSNEVQADWLFR